MHEAEIETAPEGKVPAGAGWFVLNLGEMAWGPDPTRRVSWIANERAARHGASVAKTTSRGTEVYGEDLQATPASGSRTTR